MYILFLGWGLQMKNFLFIFNYNSPFDIFFFVHMNYVSLFIYTFIIIYGNVRTVYIWYYNKNMKKYFLLISSWKYTHISCIHKKVRKTLGEKHLFSLRFYFHFFIYKIWYEKEVVGVYKNKTKKKYKKIQQHIKLCCVMGYKLKKRSFRLIFEHAQQFYHFSLADILYDAGCTQ